MKIDWIVRQVKRSPHLVSLKRTVWAATARVVRGCDLRIIEGLDVFAPNSAGPLKARARLTIQAANQTFPRIVDLLSLVKAAPIGEPIPIYSLPDTEGKRLAAARLKALFDEHGSDKGTPHDYHQLYGSILAQIDSITDIIEVGIGTNNKDVVSNMGRDGTPGASLRAFRDFLPQARVYGADVDRRILFQDDRIQTFYVDQTDSQSFAAISAAISHDFDLIIDDGLHSPHANIATLIFALGRLKVGGWFVVEDIVASALPVWRVISTLLPEDYDSQLIRGTRAFLFSVERKK